MKTYLEVIMFMVLLFASIYAFETRELVIIITSVTMARFIN